MSHPDLTVDEQAAARAAWAEAAPGHVAWWLVMRWAAEVNCATFRLGPERRALRGWSVAELDVWGLS